MLEYLMWKLIDNNGNVKSADAIVEFLQFDLEEAEKEFGIGSHKIEQMTKAEWFDYRLNAIRNTTAQYILRLECTQDCIGFDTEEILHGVYRRLDKVLTDWNAAHPAV